MSRFFHGGMGDSDSSEEEEELYTESEEEETEEEESEEELEDEDEVSDEGDEDEEEENRFLQKYIDDSDDSDEDGKRVVKSAKDKRVEEIEASIKSIENAQKINDWVTISNEFDKLNRLLEAMKRTGENRVPKMYIKGCADLEDFMNEALKKEKTSGKKMSPSNARALNTMKQRLRKNNRLHEADIAKYREDKDAFMAQADEEEAVAAPAKKRAEVVVPGDQEDNEGFSVVGAGGKALAYTPESIFKNLRAILEARGKKNTDKVEQIKILEGLLGVAQTPYQKIRVLLTLIATRFDLSSGATAHMPAEQWLLAEKEVNRLLSTLEETKNYVVIETAEEWDDDEKPPAPQGDEIFKIAGSVVSLVERLDDELTRALQQVDPHTTDYIDRLQNEQSLYTTIVRSQLYFEHVQNKLGVPATENLNRVIYRRLEHVYFKPAQVVVTSEEKTWSTLPESAESVITPRSTTTDATELIKTLCVYLYKRDDAGVLRTRAMLAHVYHYAIHNKFYKARDMLLMSHLQEHIQNADVSTQVLYNRTLVQIGLCAFRAGLIYEALTALQEIMGSNRVKELLAQGVQMQRYAQVSPEQERLEKQRQLPFHMHINLELLEAAYLTCSMLLEIPALAATGSSPDLKKRVISKTFRRMLEYHERQIFTGPPENTRDHVMQAAKALAAGEWKRSTELISAIKIWELLPDPEATKTMLSEKIQEEGLRTYLFTYAPFYDTISIGRLSEMFSLSERRVQALVSKMIAHEEISAALDNVNKAITFRKGVELSRLQSLALTLSEKASALIDQNERTFEQRLQTGGGFEGQEGGGKRGGRGGGRGGREGGRGRGAGRGRGRQQKERA